MTKPYYAAKVAHRVTACAGASADGCSQTARRGFSEQNIYQQREDATVFLIVRPIRLACKAFVAESTPGQLALGFALGVLIGFVPKGNLLALVLGVILAGSRANLGIAAATILVVSFISPLLDPVSHQIGTWLLVHPSLNSVWTELYNTPVMPWTAFNNSVVLGSFIVGVVTLYPAYRLSKPVFEKYSARLTVWAKRFWLTRLLMGVEWANGMSQAD
ncbi:MAG: TIGR03546 family protein [Fuerstiella sp.]|nr:TIGR03546 family protein [Fuerstiella sp.]MDG2128440.1 TIGR03546 family protein [Fuerstiella sp.]